MRALALALALAGCGLVFWGQASTRAYIEGGFQVKLPRPPSAGEIAAATDVAVSPVTNVAAPAAGLTFAGAAYTYACSVASAPATLYPAVYLPGASSWQVYQGLPCVLDPAVAPQGTCSFPASSPTLQGAVWNAYKTGAGTLSGCSASPAPAAYPARVASGGGGSGTVTSVGLSMPPQFTVSGSPVTGAGTLAGAWIAQASNLVLAGPAAGAAAAPGFRRLVADDIPDTGVLPGTYANATLTVDRAGRVTSAVGGGITYWWIYDPPLRGAALSSPASAGDYTTGWLFRVYTALAITGVRVYWAGTAATLYCSLWDSGAAQLARKDITVAGSGLATATFGTAITPTPGQTYYVGCYESTGTRYTGGIPDPNNPGATVQNGLWTLITPTYTGGDNAPTSDAGWAYPYPVRAVFVGEP